MQTIAGGILIAYFVILLGKAGRALLSRETRDAFKYFPIDRLLGAVLIIISIIAGLWVVFWHDSFLLGL